MTAGDPAADLVDAGLLVPTGLPGVYGRSAAFDDVRRAVGALVGDAARAEHAEAMHFPPLVPRRQLEQLGYVRSFPHLLGTVFAFEGGERDAVRQAETAERHEDWSEFQRMTDLVLAPAACYPVYPAVAARGPLPEGGALVDTGDAYAFRREPSEEPTRLQMFHQRELVRLGEPEAVADWRDAWRGRALELLRDLGLDPRAEAASDPFFGRSGRLLGGSQLEQGLKLELVVDIPGSGPTAVASLNHHLDHFASVFGLRTSAGRATHTSCLAFGEERIAVALFRTHGLDAGGWPDAVRAALDPLQG